MGRCQSTPGLVESKDRTTVEEMWISPQPLPSAAPSFATQHTWVLLSLSHFFSFLLIPLDFLALETCTTVQSHIGETAIPIALASLTHRARWVRRLTAPRSDHAVGLRLTPPGLSHSRVETVIITLTTLTLGLHLLPCLSHFFMKRFPDANCFSRTYKGLKLFQFTLVL